MKATITRKELTECVRNAITRVMKEGKTKKNGNNYDFEDIPRGCKQKHSNERNTFKGNKGNFKWEDLEDDENYDEEEYDRAEE